MAKLRQLTASSIGLMAERRGLDALRRKSKIKAAEKQTVEIHARGSCGRSGQQSELVWKGRIFAERRAAELAVWKAPDVFVDKKNIEVSPGCDGGHS